MKKRDERKREREREKGWWLEGTMTRKRWERWRNHMAREEEMIKSCHV